MQELLDYLLKSILKHPQRVQVSQNYDQETDTQILSVVTDPEDTGLAIGKGGQVVNALRDLLKVAAGSNQQRLFIQIKTDSPDQN